MSGLFDRKHWREKKEKKREFSVEEYISSTQEHPVAKIFNI